MKKVLFYVLALAAYCTVSAQNIIDADDKRNPNDFYQNDMVVGKKAMPYPPVRKSDVIWETIIWREIDMNEKFNQFFYFPTDEEKSTQGRTNLVNLIYHGVERGEIPAYEDDDMTKEFDVAEAIRYLIGEPITVQIPQYDEDGLPMTDPETEEPIYKDSVKNPSFDGSTATRLKIKEKWYIDKQDTRQKVRIVGLAFDYLKEMEGDGGQTRQVPAESFWIPMDDMRVRQVFVNANAFDENNDVVERSYDDIFIQRYFDSYITRESNVYNRAISNYLTGEDAILESQKIEDKIFDMESDMWEY